MNYLVTGAGGFIGSAIAKQLIKCGHSVITIDNFSTGYRENVPQGVEIIEGDVASASLIKSLSNKKFDAIFHIAGQSSGEVSFENPVYDLQTNTQSTLLLLKLAQNSSCKNFIYASSMSVYGDVENNFSISERYRTLPKSLYAVGKMASENYMRIFSEQYGLTCTALRFFNVYGVGQNLKNLKQGMASIYLAMALKDKHILVKGSKDRFRDFVYIDDVVSAVMASLKINSGFSIYNVCTGKPTKVEEVINEIKKNLDYSISVEYLDGTPGDQFGIFGDNSKILQDLKWSPRYSFSNGIKEMVNWAMSL